MTTDTRNRRTCLATVVEFELVPDAAPDGLGERARRVRRLVVISAVAVVIGAAVLDGTATRTGVVTPSRAAAVTTIQHAPVCCPEGSPDGDRPHVWCGASVPGSPSAEVAMRRVCTVAVARARTWTLVRGSGVGRFHE